MTKSSMGGPTYSIEGKEGRGTGGTLKRKSGRRRPGGSSGGESTSRREASTYLK